MFDQPVLSRRCRGHHPRELGHHAYHIYGFGQTRYDDNQTSMKFNQYTIDVPGTLYLTIPSVEPPDVQ